MNHFYPQKLLSAADPALHAIIAADQSKQPLTCIYNVETTRTCRAIMEVMKHDQRIGKDALSRGCEDDGWTYCCMHRSVRRICPSSSGQPYQSSVIFSDVTENFKAPHLQSMGVLSPLPPLPFYPSPRSSPPPPSPPPPRHPPLPASLPSAHNSHLQHS